MKAYILRIELLGTAPLVWRRVVVPAGGTFLRLHDTIQTSTNFQGGYPVRDYHQFEFDLDKDHILVTSDEETYMAHHHYKENKAVYEDRPKNVTEQFLKFELARLEHLKKSVKKPTKIKFDAYLESYHPMIYRYNFGEDWFFHIYLEDIVEDYYFGYPTLLDGAEAGPPEDVGGIPGFERFKVIMADKNHLEYDRLYAWSKEKYYRPYDLDWTNKMLKAIGYKKTEWSRINHERYIIIEDKYRKE